MKKLIALLCALALCFSLASCSKGDAKEEKNTEANTEVTETKGTTLDVEIAMVEDGDMVVVLENNFKKAVKSFEMAYVCYNSSGEVLSSEYETTSSSDLNLAPGKKQCFDFYLYVSDCAYIDAMVTSVDFVGEEDTWKANNLKSWSKKALKATFDIEAYKTKVAALANEAAAAQENQYIDITTTFVYDNYANFVVENISDKTILEFSVIYLCYDSNGFSVGDGYETGNVSSANMLAGTKDVVSFYESSCVYVNGVISSITFDGGEKWENPDAKIWAITRDKFSVEDYNAEITAMAENAKKAETTPYLTIVSTNKFDDNQFSSQDDFDFDIKNISNKTIESSSIVVLEYDANGYAISTSPYDNYCKNSRSVGGTVNLNPGEQSGFNSSLFFEASCKQYKCIVKSVTFDDGTEWQNPYLYEWLLVNSPKYIAS